MAEMLQGLVVENHRPRPQLLRPDFVAQAKPSAAMMPPLN